MTQKGRTARESIIQESMVEFARFGYEESSINRICEQNQITKGQLYHHFKGKDSLYLSCVTRVYRIIEGLHRDMVIVDNDVAFNIEAYLDVRRKFIMDYPNDAMVFYRTLKGNPEGLDEAIQTIRSSFLNYTVGFFKTILNEDNLAHGLSLSDAIAYFMMVIEAYNAQLETLEIESNPAFMEHYDLASAQVIKMLLYGTVQRKKES